MVGMLWLVWAQQWDSYSGQYPAAIFFSILSGIGGLTILVSTLLVRKFDDEQHLDRLIFIASLAQVALLIVLGASTHGYQTDELTFAQAAASSLLHGLNPFTINFAGTLAQFSGGAGGTVTLGGQLIGSNSYPALSFLLYVPGIAIFGGHSYIGMVTDAIAWLIAGALLWRISSIAIRPYLALFLLIPVPLLWITYGDTDPLYLPFLIVAVWRWDNFSDPKARGISRWIGPVALGLACAIKQTPWLLAPFLLIGVGLEAHRRGQRWQPVILKYLLLGFAAFGIVNLPFIVWNPEAWLKTVLLPFTSASVPLGIGFGQLVSTFHMGGGNLSLFGLSGVFALLATLVLFIWRYDRLKKLFPVLPLIAIFFTLRSLGEYYVFLFPILIVAATTVTTSPPRLYSQRTNRILGIIMPALSFISVGIVAIALIIPSQLSIGIQETSLSTTQLTASVQVHNAGSQSIPVHFLLAISGGSLEVLNIDSGPSILPPNATAIYRIVSSNANLLPYSQEPYQIQVVSTQPETLVSSQPITDKINRNISP